MRIFLAILDFFYRGEANVFQENLDSYLAIAEELKGFMGNKDERVEDLAVHEKRLPFRDSKQHWLCGFRSIRRNGEVNDGKK